MKNKYWKLTLVSIFILSFTIFSITAFRTITWWDLGNYSLAAVILGVPSPPGSLLLVILGWLITKLPLGITRVFSLNLFAGFLAALTVTLTAHLCIRLTKRDFEDKKGSEIVLLGIFLSAFIFSSSETLWLHAVKFTPYILTALFTILILWVFSIWWRTTETKESLLWIFIIGLLFGLDFSVHRTNSLLILGLIIGILLRHPATFKRLKSWLYAIGGLIVGLAFHLLLIPLARRQPFLNFWKPDTLLNFWEYVSLKGHGGGFLVNLYPRNGPFWSYQAMDYLNVFRDNFFSIHKIFGLTGFLPGMLGLIGIIFLFRKNLRYALGMFILFIFSSLGAIIYFNVPEGFFRPMARHYLPSFVIFSLWIILGAGYSIKKIVNLSGNRKHYFNIAIIILLIVISFAQGLTNYRKCNGSNRYFTRDLAANYLKGLKENAILIPFGDNDTYPL